MFKFNTSSALLPPCSLRLLIGLSLYPAAPNLAAAMIYHLARKSDWDTATQNGIYPGTAEDEADGFMHFSTGLQVAESARKHRAGERDLLLIFVDEAILGDALVWEPSRGGQLFPHLYGPLSLDAVVSTVDLPLDEAGLHVFPETLPSSSGPEETA